MSAVFEFKQCITMVKATGRKAMNLHELRDGLAAVDGRAIFHHTYQYFLKSHIREYTNDFAQWAGESLEERVLAEHLSNIDPYDFPDIEGLRGALVESVDDYLRQFPEPRDAMPGEEFFFNETVTIVFTAGVWARNLAEFLMAIKYIDSSSLYYHFFDARHRLGRDDFSAWFEASLEKGGLAEQVRSIDPFMHSLEGIREHITAAVEEEVRKDMEASGVAP